jgi:dolichyl-phosphate beta-glucosyltransferase
MTDNSTIELSIIIPAFNEQERLGDTLEKIAAFLNRRDWEWEILIVDDGSADRTPDIAEEFARNQNGRARLLKNPVNLGKGGTIKHGMLEAKGRRRLFTDADNSTPIEEVDKLLAAIDEGFDIAIGSRALSTSDVEVHQPWYRETMGRTFNLIVQLLTLRGIKDSQCGFKIFTARAADAVFPRQRLQGFSFDVEVLYIARKAGFKIKEVGVRWINSPESRVHPIRDAAKMFIDVVRIRTGL